MRFSKTLTFVLVTLIGLALAHQALAAGFGNAFTYQGELRDGPNAVNGLCDFRFYLWTAVTGGSLASPNPVDISGVQVSNGRFTVDLSFTGLPFDGSARWLQIGVKAAGEPNYQYLAPRQRIAPAPYALAAAGLALPVAAWGSSNAGLLPTGLLRINQAGTSNAIFAMNTAAQGSAGYFTNSSASSAPALLAKNDGSGEGVYATSDAFRAGFFEITNAANPHMALYAKTNGTGTALYGHSVNSGYAVQGANNGPGPAAKFFINNVNNNADALIAETNGSGAALYVHSIGSGPALEIDGPIRVTGAGNNTDTPVFRHTVTSGNRTLYFDDYYYATIINNPMCNGRPNAILIVTEVAPNVTAAHENIRASSIAVGYDQPTGRWWIISTTPGAAGSLTSMDLGDMFNVMVFHP